MQLTKVPELGSEISRWLPEGFLGDKIDFVGGGRNTQKRSFLVESALFPEKKLSISQAPLNLTETNSITVELASNPGSCLTIEVIQEQQLAPPAVTFSVDPAVILISESSTLSWNSTNADSCEIDQGIGNVAVNGSIAVSRPRPPHIRSRPLGPAAQLQTM